MPLCRGRAVGLKQQTMKDATDILISGGGIAGLAAAAAALALAVGLAFALAL